MTFTAADNDDLLKLYEGLKQAYWYATTAEDKDKLTGAADGVFALITAINAKAITSKDAAYQDASLHVAATVKSLEKIQAEIDNIIKHIGTGAKLVNLIGKVLAFLA